MIAKLCLEMHNHLKRHTQICNNIYHHNSVSDHNAFRPEHFVFPLTAPSILTAKFSSPPTNSNGTPRLHSSFRNTALVTELIINFHIPDSILSCVYSNANLRFFKIFSHKRNVINISNCNFEI